MTTSSVPPQEKKKKKKGRRKKCDDDEKEPDDDAEKEMEPPVSVEPPVCTQPSISFPLSPVESPVPSVPRAEKVDDWVDITQSCEDALGAMAIGEMLEAKDFQLLQAMSAIEMMDPKMDSGFEVPLTADEAKISLPTALSDSEQANIMDTLLCHYIYWLDGHSLAQTIFSCVYLHCWDTLDQIPPLRTFCGLLMEMVRFARDLVLEANFFDDEDFSPHHFKFNLSPPEFPVSLGGPRASVRIRFVQQYMALLLKEKGAWEPLQSLLDEIQADGDGVAPNACFNAKITRALLVPGPPREVPEISREEGLPKWKTHLQCLHFIEVHYEPVAKNFTLPGALEPQVQFFTYEPDILARSFAFMTLTKPDGSIVHIEEAIMSCLVNTWLLPTSVADHVEDIPLFITHAAQFFLAWLRIRHATLARQHRRSMHLLSDLNVLQNEAGYYDNTLRTVFGDNLVNSKALRGFVIDQALQVLLGHLEVGFRLDIYDDIEVSMIYWFMDYLYGLRVFTHNEVLLLQEQLQERKGKRRAGKQIPPRQPKNASAQVLILAAEKELCRGIFRLHIALKAQAAIKTTEHMEASMPMRYNLRFRHFEHFQLPHVLTFDEFQRSCTISLDVRETKQVLDAATTSFREVKLLAEKVEKEKGLDMGSIKRVSVANTLVISQMVKRMTEGSRTRATFSNNYHPVFVSTKLTDI